MIAGVLVDRNLLKLTAQKLVLVSGPVATYIMSLLPSTGPNSVCRISALQIATIKAIMASNTSSCTWENLTVADVLAMDVEGH